MKLTPPLLLLRTSSYRSGLTSKLTFSVTVWALLISTLVSPIAFRRLLSREAVALAAAPPAAAQGKEADDEVELEAGTAPRPGGSRRHLASW